MTMNSTEKVREIEKAIKALTGAASAYQHGRVSTGKAKLGDALDILEHVAWEVGA